MKETRFHAGPTVFRPSPRAHYIRSNSVVFVMHVVFRKAQGCARSVILQFYRRKILSVHCRRCNHLAFPDTRVKARWWDFALSLSRRMYMRLPRRQRTVDSFGLISASRHNGWSSSQIPSWLYRAPARPDTTRQRKRFGCRLTPIHELSIHSLQPLTFTYLSNIGLYKR